MKTLLLFLLSAGFALAQDAPSGVSVKPDGSWMTSAVLIDKATIQKRIEDLKTYQKQVLDELQRVTGAIQDCEFWISVVDPKQKPEPPKPEPKK